VVRLHECAITRHYPTYTENISAALGDPAERLYLTLLRRHRWRMAELAESLAFGEAELRSLLGDLRADGLVVESADDASAVRAVEPGLAMATLASRRMERQPGCSAPAEPVVERIAPLDTWFTDRAGQWMRLDGMDEVSTLVERLVMCAQHETLLLTPSYLPGSFEFRPQIGETVIRHGVALKTVWGAAVLDAPAAVEYARSRGSQCPAPRAAPEVDVRAVIVDRSLAMVLGKRGHAQVLSGGPTFDSLLATADYLWQHSIELRSAVEVGDEAQRPRHELVLSLLADGLTDQAIARRIGVSVRTVRNDVALVMGSLGARSRFQAGVRAVCLGLLLS
jgi:DNA-binding CsgD family transcriptional regulator